MNNDFDSSKAPPAQAAREPTCKHCGFDLSGIKWMFEERWCPRCFGTLPRVVKETPEFQHVVCSICKSRFLVTREQFEEFEVMAGGRVVVCQECSEGHDHSTYASHVSPSPSSPTPPATR